MSRSHADVGTYWKVAGQALNEQLAAARNQEIEAFLEEALAIYAFVVEDLGTKHTKNQSSAPKLYSLVVLGFDLLRGVHALQWTLSLAPAALAARTAFESFVNLKIITTAPVPDDMVDKFVRFEHVERLGRHENGRMALSPVEVAKIQAECPEWLDPKTKKINRRIKWHGTTTNLKKMSWQVGHGALYDAIYPTTSAFVHGLSVVRGLYRVGQSVRPLPDPKHVGRVVLLTALCALMLIGEYSSFYGVELYPGAHHSDWLKRVLKYLGISGGASSPSQAPGSS